MRKLFFKFLFALGFIFYFSPFINAQNLYIDKMSVYYNPGAYAQNAYCNYSEYNSSFADVSFKTESGNVWHDSALIEFSNPTPVL